MTDRQFLEWLHDRLEFVHQENYLCDYMHKFRAITKTIPENQITPNVMSAKDFSDK